jgi:hypothetical protein
LLGLLVSPQWAAFRVGTLFTSVVCCCESFQSTSSNDERIIGVACRWCWFVKRSRGSKVIFCHVEFGDELETQLLELLRDLGSAGLELAQQRVSIVADANSQCHQLLKTRSLGHGQQAGSRRLWLAFTASHRGSRRASERLLRFGDLAVLTRRGYGSMGICAKSVKCCVSGAKDECILVVRPILPERNDARLACDDRCVSEDSRQCFSAG